MREIKFRAWDKINSRMINDLTLGSNKWPNNPEQWWNIMQYTGLKDKNGVEIYEGDIIVREYEHNKNYPSTLKHTKKVVEWQVTTRTCGWNIAISDTAVVIGNIYENPELLK